MQNTAKPICDMIKVRKNASAWRIPLGVFCVGLDVVTWVS